MTDQQKSSLSRSVTERKSSYPLRIHHNDAGKSTSPVKKNRVYNAGRSSKVHRQFPRSTLLIRDVSSAPYPMPGVRGASAGSREVLSDKEETLVHAGDTTCEFAPPPSMDVDFETGGWGDERMSIAMEGTSSPLLDESDELYAEAVEADVVGFIPISGNSMFVVEGWSRVLSRGTVRTLWS